jgi:hypothetical protein
MTKTGNQIMIRLYIVSFFFTALFMASICVYEYRIYQLNESLTEISAKLDNINGAFDMAVNLTSIK